ncbi:MAG: NADH-quinone oxidoreductase subunit F, partial [Lachnospiraceae bacterium]|nr:NADH-quinone oxidoreductase subunit F [Lachnospiraceae bacterium]
MRIVVGEGSCGIAAGAGKVYDALNQLITPDDPFTLEITGCIGMCFLEPIVDIYEGEELLTRLVHVEAKDAERIVDAVKSKDFVAIEALKIKDDDASFLTQQTRIALRNCGIIDPTDIKSYKARDGYKALEKVLKTMTPEEVIEEIKTSGLAGRGGAGFPTWFKWNAARGSEGEEKYLICNADEGDPSAFMDRAVIESDPHNLIEGMLIAAYAIGAKEAIVYVRAEYPLAIIRLENAIKQATEEGLIGDHIMGTDFSCKFRNMAGAGALVCGEETAMIESL